MAKFEAHITFKRADGDIVMKASEAVGWSYSAIDGDPVMGKTAYCYLTAYDTDGHRLRGRMRDVATAMRSLDVTVLREKIEQIVYDTKTGVNDLGPA